MSITKYTSLAELPRKIVIDGGEIFDGRTHRKPTDREKLWSKYTTLEFPQLNTTSVSCGVRQWSGMLHYPPSLQIMYILMYLNEVRDRFSTVIFSDTHQHGRAGGWINGLLVYPDQYPELNLYSKKEIDWAKRGTDPGQIIANIIDEMKGVLGSVVASEETINRNSRNVIRTFLWTVPRHKRETEDFPLRPAIDAMNEWRELNGAQA